jgi:hypothetical protein
MAVKVMVAPAIAKKKLEAERALRAEPAPRQAKKPRRRQSVVFDAEGNEVFITLVCLKCQKMRPLSLFGLRRMADGAIRNQPWCRTCRTGASVKTRRGAEPVEEAVVEEEAAESAASPRPAPGNIAAQVAAALYAGRR